MHALAHCYQVMRSLFMNLENHQPSDILYHEVMMASLYLPRLD